MKITRNPIPKGRGAFQRVAPLWVWGEISLKINNYVFSCKHYFVFPFLIKNY